MRSLSLLLVTACGRIDFDPVELESPCTFGAFSTPTLVTEVSTADRDWAPSVSRDMLQMVFSREVAGNGQDLLITQRDTPTSRWDIPTPIAELATTNPDEDDPTLSKDGTELIFGNAGTLYRTTRSPGGTFAPPVVLFSDPSLSFVEGPELSADGLTLYFNAGNPTPGQIYTAHRGTAGDAFTGFAPLATNPDPTGDAGWPTLSADQLEMFFSSAHGTERDIFRTTRASLDDPFGPAVVVPELSSAGEEFDPELSFDGTTIWFSSDKAGGTSHDIYTATRSCL